MLESKNKDVVAKKICEMSAERVAKVLIFMAGMEAEESVKKAEDEMKKCNQTNNLFKNV